MLHSYYSPHPTNKKKKNHFFLDSIESMTISMRYNMIPSHNTQQNDDRYR